MAGKGWLNYANLSDDYERKARLLPAILTILFLFPVSYSLGGPLAGWIQTLVGGIGIGAVVAVGLSHLSSAVGNRLQNQMWPRWPYDAPTNQWLLPTNNLKSEQQRFIWYSAIKRLTKLDIAAARNKGEGELENIINDAVGAVRNLLWKTDQADRLRIHNIDYGFARNFTGFRIVWVPESIVSLVGCIVGYIWYDTGLLWCIVSAVLALISLPLAFVLLPDFVRQKADRYAESFFGAMIKLDQGKTGTAKVDTKPKEPKPDRRKAGS